MRVLMRVGGYGTNAADNLCHEESPTPSVGLQETLWGPAPLTPWDYIQSLEHVNESLSPSCKPLEQLKDVLESGSGNKSSIVKVIRTQPLLFPADMEGPPEGKGELSDTSENRS